MAFNDEQVDEARVENAFENVQKLRRSAWNLSIAETAALAERVRIELLLDKTMSRSQKRWYRAFSDFLDDVVDVRLEREGVERDHFHSSIIAYLRGLLHTDEESDDDDD